jgi:hypothetical protein
VILITVRACVLVVEDERAFLDTTIGRTELKAASRRALCCVIALIFNTGAAEQARAQTVGPCDPTLRARPGALGYKQRDPSRCEGLYRALTSGEIELISFARRLPSTTTGTKGRIEVDVPASPTSPRRIAIRVSTLKEDVYYQLDAVTSSGATIGWPTSEVLDQVGLTSKDLGFLGWREVGREREFVPLGVKESASAAPGDASIVLVVRSALPLEWVKWRLYRLGEPAKQEKYSDVPGNAFPAGWPIEIRIPMGRTGSHVVDVYAMPENRDMPEILSARLLF